MRERTSKRPRRAAAIAGVALAMAMALGAAGARAADADDENVPLDTKLLRQFMKDLGLQRDGQAADRLPRARTAGRAAQPRSAAAAKRRGGDGENPAWPKDPDVTRRKEAAAAEKARLKGNVSVEEQQRALRPDELDKPGRAAKGTDAKGAGQTAEDTAKPLTPSQLGTDTKKLFGSIVSSFSPATAGSRAVHRRAAARQHDRPACRLSDAVAQLPLRHGHSARISARPPHSRSGSSRTDAELPRQRAPSTFRVRSTLADGRGLRSRSHAGTCIVGATA